MEWAVSRKRAVYEVLAPRAPTHLAAALGKLLSWLCFLITQLNSVTKKTVRPQATFDLCPITSHQSAPSLLWRMGKEMKPIVMAAFLSTQVASPSTAVLAVVDQVNNSLLFAFSYHYIHQLRRTLFCRWWRRLRRWRWQSGRGLLRRRWLIYQWESCVWRDGSRQQLWPWVGHFRTIVTSSSNTYTRHAVNYLINPKSKTANRTNHDATKCVNVNSLLFIVEFKKFIQKNWSWVHTWSTHTFQNHKLKNTVQKTNTKNCSSYTSFITDKIIKRMERAAERVHHTTW